MLPAATADPIPFPEFDSASRRVRREIEARVGYFADRPAEIEGRLVELDREWALEQALDVQTAAATLAGSLLALGSRRWILVPAVLSGFMLQHAFQGRCAPRTLLRRLGFRTAAEIELERYALKAVRGDFRDLSPPGIRSAQERMRQALRVVRL
ncbi:hypothetical protein STVA_11510 [Allostella vacuolata]|nr:hypothetical protein STVA_11510 [Stella vacuolata]